MHFCHFSSNGKLFIIIIIIIIIIIRNAKIIVTLSRERYRGTLCLEKRIICPALQTTLQQQLLAIHRLETRTKKIRFQISEQITVTGSQIWTVGRLV